MLDSALRHEIVVLTQQEDRVGLISCLVGALNKLIKPCDTRFFDLHHEIVTHGYSGKRTVPILIEPLDPNNSVFPVHAIEGVEGFLTKEHEIFSVFPLSGSERQRIIFPIIYEGTVKSLLLLDRYGELPAEAISLIHFFCEMFNNLQRTIRAKDQDPLTGLFNRRSFDTTISQVLDAFSHTTRKDRLPAHGACLAVFDIDHFKRVNDLHGHAIGDEVLILFARLMEEMFRHGDRLYRFGGEEFMAIIIEVDIGKALCALERFRKAVESFPFPQICQLTVSIGAVMVNTSDYSPVLLEKSDKALYYAKEHGRNQIHFYDRLVADGKLEEVEHLANDIEIWSKSLHDGAISPSSAI